MKDSRKFALIWITAWSIMSLFIASFIIFFISNFGYYLDWQSILLIILSVLLFPLSFIIGARYKDDVPQKVIDTSVRIFNAYFGFVGVLFLVLLTFNILNIFYSRPEYVFVAFYASIIIFIYSLYTTYNFKLTKYTIHSDKIKEDTKIYMISDVHLGRIHQRYFFKKIIKFLTKHRAEYLFIVGDLFDGPKVDKQQYLTLFREAVSKMNIYFVKGNHDTYSNEKLFLEIIHESGMHILKNEKVEIGGINFVGIDYFEPRDNTQFANYLQFLARYQADNTSRAPTVYLKHVPNLLKELVVDPSAILSIHGHTHNGQVWPFSMLANKIYNGFAYGLNKFGSMNVITSSGIGTFGPPIRFLTRAEVVEIEFIKQ